MHLVNEDLARFEDTVAVYRAPSTSGLAGAVQRFSAIPALTSFRTRATRKDCEVLVDGPHLGSGRQGGIMPPAGFALFSQAPYLNVHPPLPVSRFGPPFRRWGRCADLKSANLPHVEDHNRVRAPAGGDSDHPAALGGVDEPAGVPPGRQVVGDDSHTHVERDLPAEFRSRRRRAREEGRRGACQYPRSKGRAPDECEAVKRGRQRPWLLPVGHSGRSSRSCSWPRYHGR